MSARRGLTTALTLIVALALAFAFPFVFSTFVVDTAIVVLIYWMVGMGTVILAGPGRQLSLGFAATFGVSAYTEAILSVSHHWPILPASLAAVAAGEAVALVLAVTSLHLRTIYLLMVSLAQLMFINEVESDWNSVTGGSDGVFGVQRPGGLTNDGFFFWLVAAVAIATAALLTSYVRSRRGHRLTAVGDSEVKMRALGHRTYLIRLEAYLIGGLAAAVAGLLFVWFEGVISPGDFGFSLGVAVVVLVIIGGMDSVLGALTGAALVTLGQNVLSGFVADWQIIVGAVFIAVVIVAPDGVAGVWRRRVSGSGRSRSWRVGRRGTPAAVVTDSGREDHVPGHGGG